MKKIALSLTLVALLAAFGCSKQEKTETSQQPKTEQPQTAAPPAQTAQPSATAPAAPAGGEKAATAEANGEQVYKQACAACHDTGAAGAPKVGDKEAWKPLIAEGMDDLVKTAIEGKGAMPAKGGHPDLSDAQVKAAVSYMVEKSQ